MSTSYRVWTTRALLVWVPLCLALGVAPPVLSLALLITGHDVPWSVHIVNSLMPLAMGYAVYRRHGLYAGFRDRIVADLHGGAWLVSPDRALTSAEVEAIDRGLLRARVQVADALDRASASHRGKFVIVRDTVTVHRAGKTYRVGGLTYSGGPILLEYTTDLALLTDRARHEGCHAALNAAGVADYTGDMHHAQFPELFA